MPTSLSLDLNSLLETSKFISSSLDIDVILSHILRTVMGKFLLTKAAVMLAEKPVNEKKTFSLAASRGLANAPKQFASPDDLAKTHDLELLIPIHSSSRLLGYLALGKKSNRTPFSESEKNFCESIASLAASALENALSLIEMRTLNKTLDLTVQKLITLFELSNEYRLDLSREDTLRILTHSIAGHMLVRRYLVALIHESKKVVTEFTRGVEKATLSEGQKFQFDLTQAVKETAPTEIQHESYPSLYLAGLEWIIPLRVNDKTIGVFCCGERIGKQPFSGADIDFMSLAAAQAANALEQARLFTEILDKQAIEKEMQVAQEIQTALLPKSLPKDRCIDVAAKNIPSKQVGGDYYDIIKLDSEHFFFGIADVTGKGTPAALLMANLQASIKAYMTAYSGENFDLSSIVGKINNIIYDNTPSDKFITFFCGILNTTTKKFVSVNAGHNPPYILRKNGDLETLTLGGVILGVISTLMPYETETTQLETGDILFMFTDGITEAMDEARAQFGEARVEAFLKELQPKSSAEILNAVVVAASEFQPVGQQYDDITAICVKLC
jgi:phosphoserine phosphatase RsbU/P